MSEDFRGNVEVRGLQALHGNSQIQQSKDSGLPKDTQGSDDEDATFFGVSSSLPVINKSIGRREVLLQARLRPALPHRAWPETHLVR
jgi:hypothetical protein